MYLINTTEVGEPENYSDFKTLQAWGLEMQAKLRFPAGCFVPDTTASWGSTGVGSCIILADSGATTNQVAISFRQPSIWTAGRLKATIHYSASASGSAYYVRALWYTAKSGDTINTGSTSAYDTLSAIGGAWELGEHTFSAERTIDPTDTFVTLALRRDGTHASDTDTGNLCILEATVTYEQDRY